MKTPISQRVIEVQEKEIRQKRDSSIKATKQNYLDAKTKLNDTMWFCFMEKVLMECEKSGKDCLTEKELNPICDTINSVFEPAFKSLKNKYAAQIATIEKHFEEELEALVEG